jgi:hypothetical protein
VEQDKDLKAVEQAVGELAADGSTLDEVYVEVGLRNVCEVCGADPDEPDEEKLYNLGWIPSSALGMICPRQDPEHNAARSASA